MSPEKSGVIGWGLVAGTVFVADRYLPESMTHAFHRGMENPVSRPFVLGALAVTAAHLLDVIPRQYDPFYLTIDRKPM